MQLRNIEDKKVKNFIQRLMQTSIVSYRLEPRDIVSFDSRLHDGYKVMNRLVRVFDPIEAIQEIEDHISSYDFNPKKHGNVINLKTANDTLEYLTNWEDYYVGET